MRIVSLTFPRFRYFTLLGLDVCGLRAASKASHKDISFKPEPDFGRPAEDFTEHAPIFDQDSVGGLSIDLTYLGLRPFIASGRSV